MELNIELSQQNQDLDSLKKGIITFNSYTDKQYNNEELQSIVNRAEIVIKTLIIKIEKTQEEFFTTGFWKDANSYVTSLNSNISNFITSNNTSYLSQATSYINNIINLIPKLCFTDEETINEGLATTVGNYKKSLTSVKNKLSTYENDVKKYQDEIKKLTEQVEKQAKIINGFSEQFNQKQLEQNSAFVDKISEYNKKNAENQEVINKNWEEIKQVIETKVDEKIKELNDNNIKNTQEWTNIKNTYNKDFESLKTSLLLDIASTIKEINEKKEEVEKLYGLFGKTVTSGNFKKHADNETWVIWILYILSFLIMVTIAIFLGVSIYFDYQTNHSFNWLDILLRVPISFVFYAPALYLAMEAKKRHNRQIELRDLEIKISAIDPYLKNIDFVESRRENGTDGTISAREVKLELAKKLFSPKQNNNKNDNIIIPKELIDLFGQMSKVCNSIKNNNDKVD